MRTTVVSGGALLAGAGAGLLAMYLLDSQSGPARRAMIRDPATNLGRQLADRAKHHGQWMADAAHDRFDSVRDRASDMMGDAQHRVNLALGREHEHHYVAQTSCALGSLALGAGAMWMFDPEQGSQRRQWLMDRTWGALNQVGEFFAAAGRSMWSRTSEERPMRGSEPTRDENASVESTSM